ncbi:MAG: hypothetical protein JWQ66_2949 [Mucilaginibacter sp.]|nr:hypothetical protein [Mucilaginibacter sp.]
MEVFIHQIKLTGKTEFAEKFNDISDLYQTWEKYQTAENWQAYFDAKLALEMGL